MSNDPHRPAEDPLELRRVRPDWCAFEPMTRSQKISVIAICLCVLALTCWRPWSVARAFVWLATVFYVVVSLYKLMLVRFSVVGSSAIEIEPAQLEALSDEELPVYSILVPMYREASTLPRLVDSLQRLDYPADKKDVQLLLEEDDDETRAAAASLELPPGFRVTVIPESFPRTKPKACNIGLARALGRYLVIYDAEDRPEPDQLKKAVVAFREVGHSVVCLQSSLNFYNPRQNWLTRFFAAEYSAWFDLNLPGLSALGAVIPLGGTSNHFVTDVLRELHGWDAYNVTEDCDLGVRICRAGYTSRVLKTTTWEEACSSFPFWIRQRTRWLKGYIQTYLVHMRKPLALLRDLGFENFCHYQLLIGGVVATFLLNPLFWALALVWFLWRPTVLSGLFPLPVFAMGAVCLFVGNFVFVYTGALACYRRRYFDLVKVSLLAPFYWGMMSFSGWRAFLQFFSNPFYWEKTRHGLFADGHAEEGDGC